MRREQIVLHREVEVEALVEALLAHPLQVCIAAPGKRVLRAPADVLLQALDAEEDAAVPVMEVRGEPLQDALHGEQRARRARRARGADVDVRLQRAAAEAHAAGVEIVHHAAPARTPSAGFAPTTSREGVDVALVAEAVAAGQVVAAAERDRLAHQHAQRARLVVDVTDLPEVVPSPGISTGRPRASRTNMRCSRSGRMLCGPKTIENADDRGREAALAVLAQQDGPRTGSCCSPYSFWRSLRSTGWSSVIGSRSLGRVDHGRAREHVVPGAAAQQLAHALRVLGAVGADVVHAVPVAARERRAQRSRVGAIGDQAATRPAAARPASCRGCRPSRRGP